MDYIENARRLIEEIHRMDLPKAPAEILYPPVFFLFGACMGSFLNVVIYRLPRRVSVVWPGSRCPGCGRKIRSWENLPILSWLMQFGHCRGCNLKISWRYPMVELLTALLWAGAGYAFCDLALPMWPRTWTLIAILWFVTWLVAISLIDIDLTIIPDELNFSGIAMSLGLSAWLPQLHFMPDEAGVADYWFGAMPHISGFLASALGCIVGAGSIYLLNLAGTGIFRKTIERVRETEDDEVDSAMGFGDVKLMAFLGAFLGWTGALLTFMLSAFLGAFVGTVEKLRTGSSAGGKGLFDSLRQRWRTGNSMIPYGPFLCIGALVVLFWREPVTDFVSGIFRPPQEQAAETERPAETAPKTARRDRR